MGAKLGFIFTGLALGFMGGCASNADCTRTDTCSCEDPSFGPSHPEVCSCVDPYYRDAHRDLCSPPDALDGSASDAPSADGADVSAALEAAAVDGEGGSADASGSDASDGGAADAVADVKEEPKPPPCDATKLPSEDACVIDAQYGVFVSPLGSDTNTGTPISPLKTLSRALSAARGRRVYACATAGDYVEQVAISGATALFGGFDCSGPTWSYSTTRGARVKPTTGIALTIMATSSPVSLEDVEFDAPPTTMKGESSVAAFVSGSGNVQLKRVKLVAQDAQPGADAPVAAPNYEATLMRSDLKIAGRSAMGASGGEAQTCAALCANGVLSSGGKGGDGSPSAPAGNGLAGAPVITPPSAAFATGAGGVGETVAGGPCVPGKQGSNAPAQPGGTGATIAGVLTATGWNHGADGGAGTVGGPGQGGGGGGGGKDGTVGGGGGGACGGCGGAAGAGGKTGGSSFALLSYQSSVQLFGCTLIAGNGGPGGKGADGQVGQIGGLFANGSVPGCPGGPGGQGGGGGGGGGGAGGLSVAMGHIGTAPGRDTAMVAQVATLPAPGGAAGAGGLPLATKGTDGVAVLVQDLAR